MKFIFILLLIVFASVSAYVTYLFTSSLAQSATMLVAFSALGLAFDTLKCFLPATFISSFKQKEFINGAVSLFVYCLLVAFSFYASYSMLDNSTQDKAQATEEYQRALSKYNDAKAEYDRLRSIKHFTIAENNQLPKVEAAEQELKALKKGSTISASVNLIMNLVIATLLELSVLACHISLNRNAPKNASRNAPKTTPVDESSRSAPSLASSGRSTHRGTRRGAVNSGVTLDDLVTLLRSNHEGHLSQRDIKAKYRVSSDKAAQAKKILAEKTETSNLIILPTTTTTTKRAN